MKNKSILKVKQPVSDQIIKMADSFTKFIDQNFYTNKMKEK